MLLAREHRLNLGYIVIAEVGICYVWGWLVITGDIGHIGDDILLGLQPDRINRLGEHSPVS